MERRRPRLYFIPVMIAMVLLSALAVMLLWNAILTDIFNLKRISYGQALGLTVLCRILFGSMRGGPPGAWRGRGGHPLHSKFMNLSEEERARFKQEWKDRMGRRPGNKDC